MISLRVPRSGVSLRKLALPIAAIIRHRTALRANAGARHRPVPGRGLQQSSDSFANPILRGVDEGGPARGHPGRDRPHYLAAHRHQLTRCSAGARTSCPKSPLDRLQEPRTRYRMQLHITPGLSLAYLVLDASDLPSTTSACATAMTLRTRPRVAVLAASGDTMATATCQLLPANFSRPIARTARSRLQCEQRHLDGPGPRRRPQARRGFRHAGDARRRARHERENRPFAAITDALDETLPTTRLSHIRRPRDESSTTTSPRCTRPAAAGRSQASARCSA